MASINKLSIRGIRSFSPDDDEQVVEFSFPCTIIVGANGCGKTTIIESLKYAVAGSLPPGNRAGQAFVHDPKSIGQTSVKGNVKLRITNRAGAPMVIIRSMEVTQKKTTMTFKQLDGVLRTIDPSTGERVSLSHKCTELDRQIPTLLGVSKAILESVIFCHQEESSWPLQEGAVLKKRFDDIFDSTRYSKALESFKKTKKDLQLEVKDLKGDLNGLSSHKHAAKTYKKEREQQHALLEELENDMKMYTDEIKEIDSTLNNIRDKINEIEEVKNKIEITENDIASHEMIIDKQREMLGAENDLTKEKTAKQLKDMLRDFDKEMNEQISKKNDLEDDVKSMQNQINSLRKQHMEYNKSIGKFAAEKEANENRIKDRFMKMESIATSYSIDLQQTLSQQNNNNNTQMSMYSTNTNNTTSTSFIDDSSTILDNSLVGNNNNTNSNASNNTGTQDESIIMSISNEDMESFYRNLKKTENELRDSLKAHKDKFRIEEDRLQDILMDLSAKLKSIENERAKLDNEQKDSQREILSLSQQIPSGRSRLLKSDVEDAKKQAANYAKSRDQLTQDPKRNQIPIEIRSYEEKIDKIKRIIDRDQAALTQLRSNLEARNSIEVFKDQLVKDLELLKESFEDEDYNLQKYRLKIPTKIVPMKANDNDSVVDSIDIDGLNDEVDEIINTLKEKLDDASLNLSKNQEEVTKLQQMVSENMGTLSHTKQALANQKMKMMAIDRSNLVQVRDVIKEMNTTENEEFGKLAIDEHRPKELLLYIDNRLEEIDDDSPESAGDSETVKSVVKRLKQLSKIIEDNQLKEFQCPCCKRSLDDGELEVFQTSIKELANPKSSALLQVDADAVEKYNILKSKYQHWKKIVSDNMNEILNYQRIAEEMKTDLEPSIKELEHILSTRNIELSAVKMDLPDLQMEVEELQRLQELSRRWTDDILRINQKKMQIVQKQSELSTTASPNSDDRDLQTVERELNESLEEKDNFTNKINRLNKDMSQLNDRISQLSDQAAKTDKLARDKEAKFLKEQQASERKKILTTRISSIDEEKNKLQDQIPPLKTKIEAKEKDKQRLRKLFTEEEEKLTENLNVFVSEVKHLRDITKQIEDYANSNKIEEFNRYSDGVAKVVDAMKEKEAKLDLVQADLDKMTKAVDDQQNHKKVLKENVELLENERRLEGLQKDISQLEDELKNVDEYDTCKETFEKLSKKRQRCEASKARLEGRRGEMVEQIRSINRKLSTPEYKDIDERHRIAMIKHETTQIAVEDLDKYANALDKALLRFHSIKIGEINKIIRELWLLTYKGEDIQNIELVSGQDPGSRASKSYNYRVVMTKNNTKLDMRGRCSAGQKVLASIVIRLALAETFGINCGCIALDEPTVNLDYNNKRGLAIALAQIVASRAQQRNFQLILITHDEDFVGMMKTELATQSGFPMPEKYFQVRREEGADGKFYSKIDAVDWDELL